MQDINSSLAEKGFSAKLTDQDQEILVSCVGDLALAETNLLRSIMSDAATRLQNNGPRHEIAHQLEEASSESFQTLASENVEIEIDDEEILTKQKSPKAHDNPVFAALYQATALQDGISALRIAGEEPSLERHNELNDALRKLRDVLNTELKD